MKKRIKNILVIVGIICLGIGGFFVTKEKKEDYEIISSIKSSHDNYESVTLSVIVNKRKYDAEALLYEISSNYWSLHENTDEIYISITVLCHKITGRCHFTHQRKCPVYNGFINVK